jgi:hypothetical protein
MALGFSSGLLTGLQQYGQGGGTIPADPRQRDLMQAAGVTNPLLQQFGKSVGGLFGVETRSPMDQFGAAIQDIDTSTPEGKKALLSALSKVDPLSAVKMSEAFRQEALDEPKRAADLARIQAQTELAKQNAKYNNISVVKNVTVTDPLTGAVTTKPQQFTITVDENGKIPESVIKQFGDLGVTQEDVDTAMTQETIQYFLDENGKRRTVSYKNGIPYEIKGDELVEISPEVVDNWQGVGDIKEPDLPSPPPPLETSAPRTTSTRRGQSIPTGDSPFDGMFTGGRTGSVREQRGR